MQIWEEEIDEADMSEGKDVKQVLDEEGKSVTVKEETLKVVKTDSSLAIVLDFSSTGRLLRVKRIQHPTPLVDAETTYQELINDLKQKFDTENEWWRRGRADKLDNQKLKDYLQSKKVIVSAGQKIDKKMLFDKKLNLEKSVIQESVLVSCTGDYYFVRVIQSDQNHSNPKFVKPKDITKQDQKTTEERHLEFYGKQPYEFKFAGKMIILIQKKGKEIFVFDTEAKDFKKGQFDRFFTIEEKKETGD